MKRTYMISGMTVVRLQHHSIICQSTFGMNRSLQDEDVDDAWVKENSGSGGIFAPESSATAGNRLE